MEGQCGRLRMRTMKKRKYKILKTNIVSLGLYESQKLWQNLYLGMKIHCKGLVLILVVKHLLTMDPPLFPWFQNIDCCHKCIFSVPTGRRFFEISPPRFHD